MEIVSSGGEPKLRVGGVPFFVHAAQFDYFRIPQDLWAHSLLRYRDLGINTIDIRIPWNWHEPRDAQFDFDGHTNPNRDLRGFLSLIAQMRFKLIVRPGPVIGDHWRNSGIPSWLLAYSEYGMSAADIQDGVAPPDAQLADRDSNAAARGWLANEIHMTYTRRWLTAVARVLAPYSAKNMISIGDPSSREGESQAKQIPGPLLFVALDDAVTVSPGAEAPDLAKYLAELRRALARGGLDAISFLNIPNAAAQGLAALPSASVPKDSSPVRLAGQWIFDPQASPLIAKPVSVNSATILRKSLLTTTDASSLSFLAHALATQPDFPPFLSVFSATTFAPAGDTRAAQPALENTLLASRLLLGSGIRGIVYSPLQDTLTPAGWETPSAARYFRWDAPLDLAGNKGPRAGGVMRNGQFISAWSAMLAASHVQSDFGIVDLRVSAEKTDEAASTLYAEEIEKLCRAAALAGYAPEFVNPAAQAVERLLRDPVILLDVPQDVGRNFQLSERAQEALVEFVRRGGVLVYFPARPAGSRLGPLWQGAPAIPAAGDTINEWQFERGRIMASSTDFYSWVHLARDSSQNVAEPESSAGIKSFAALMERSGARRVLRLANGGELNPNLIVSQLVSNDDAARSARSFVCAEKQLCAAELISVTNLNPEQPAKQSFEISEPRLAGATSVPPKITFDVTVPARDSLLLPVHAPLCSAAAPGERCSDEVIVAGAELIGAQREGKTLELAFYAPALATVRLRLESAPSKVEFEGNFRAENEWKQETGELEVQLPRGPSPDYARVLRIHLRYTPHVTEKSDPEKENFRGLEYEVYNAIRYPLGSDVTIPTSPPLLIADANSGGRMVIATHNLSDDLRISDFSLDGAFHGTGYARVFGDEQQITPMRFQPSRSAASSPPAAPPPDGLLSGQLAIHSGHERGTGPVLFLTANDAGNSHYQYDFERSGAPDWVLESSRLRLIVSPAYSGRALALVDKSTNDDLITLGGALHDFLITAGARPQDAGVTSDFAFNRGYEAKWIEGKPDTGLRLSYREYENSPAGLHVEKTLHFVKPETIEASYHISFVTAPSPATGKSDARRSFISELSIPVPAAEEGNTQFCWETAPSSTTASPLSKANAAGVSQCEDFISRGEPISLPEGVAHLEIHSSGRHPLVVEWTAGRAIIVPKAFSAQIRFVVRVPQPLEPPGEFTLRYTAGDAQ